MTQADLAEAVGVHRQAVSGWERGLHLPTARNLDDIARALGTSAQVLRDGDMPTWGESTDPRRPARVREQRATFALVPPRAYQLIYDYTLQLQSADVPEEQVEEARRLMSGQTFNTMRAHMTDDRDEEGWVRDVRSAWALIKSELRRQGFDL